MIYLILGGAGSGRREIVADLIDGGLADGETAAVLLSEGEAPDPADKGLGEVKRWRWSAEKSIDADLPAGAGRVFFVTDGRANPVDQIEAFKAWVAGQPVELARVLCVVNCRLAEQNPPLLLWFDACVHFSDVVLLHRREGVANKWMSDFRARFKDRHFPCLIEMVKGGRVHNPALVLEPQTLRMSHAFDEEGDWIVVDEEGEEVDVDDDDVDEDEEVEMVLVEDPYFVRDNGGRRAKEIPDIGKFL